LALSRREGKIKASDEGGRKMTGEQGSIEEILELAIAREMEAYRLYMDMANRVVNPMTRKMFEDLAQEELEHKGKLELEVLKTGRVLPTAKLDLSDYMTSDGPKIDMDYRDILVGAIQKEKISFRLYVDLAAAVEDGESREVLLSLAEEEARHKLRFEIEYDNLTAGGKQVSS
jgi:rubrerythrin